MKKYYINNKLVGSYVNREANKNIKNISIFILVFLVIMFVFTYSYGVHKILMLPMTIFFIVIIGIIYVTSLLQIRNKMDVTCFVISEEGISKTLDKPDLNLVNQFSAARNESRYGAKLDQYIKFREIESTKILVNEIVIKSVHYNFFNGNGKISIPKEIKNFDDLKSEIINNSEKFKLKNLSI